MADDTIAEEPTGQSGQVDNPQHEPESAGDGEYVPSATGTIAMRTDSHSDQVEKCYGDGMATEGYPYYGATSFGELEELQAVEEASMEVHMLTNRFQTLVGNIMRDEEIVNKEPALNRLMAEFTARVGQSMQKPKERTGLLAAIGNLFGSKQDKATKRENGKDFPKGDFAYTPTDNPSDWKLRLTESPGGEPTTAQLGRAAAAFSSGGFRGNRVQLPASAVAAVKRRIRNAYSKLGVKPDEMPDSIKSNFMIWKDSAGQYRWFAIYSNQFRDEDDPPEIISEKSHRNFIDLVDAGAVDYPELWHWHTPGTAWGKADWLDYADGFAVASGYVYEGHEKEAEAISQLDDIRVSHGMPSRFIVRNKQDPTIIDVHVTAEISDLPGYAAANPLTQFVVLNKELDMGLNPDKKQYLVQAGLSSEVIAELEKTLASKKEAADNAGLESKEQTPAESTAETPAVAAPEAQPAYVTAQEVADAVTSVIAPFTEALTAVTSQLAAMQAEVKALKQSDEEKIAEKSSATPRASLQALLAHSIGGMAEAQIDGRTTLAKAGPKQAPQEAEAVTGMTYIDKLIAQSRAEVAQ